jgi:hypothetical protein
MFIILLLMTGCAHTTSPSPLPESIQQQLGKIGGQRVQRKSRKRWALLERGDSATLEEEPVMVLQLEREVVSMVAGMAIFAIPAGAASSVRSGR